MSGTPLFVRFVRAASMLTRHQGIIMVAALLAALGSRDVTLVPQRPLTHDLSRCAASCDEEAAGHALTLTYQHGASGSGVRVSVDVRW